MEKDGGEQNNEWGDNGNREDRSENSCGRSFKQIMQQPQTRLE